MTVVTGASGQLGTAFRAAMPAATFLTRAELDLTDAAAIRACLDDLRPDLVVNCAAYTAVDHAEEEEDLANQINGSAVATMAERCAEYGARFATFSTDYVFGGQSDRPWVESDPTDPINAYGRSKRLGELATLAAGGLVIRTSWLVSGTHDNFVATMLRLAASGRPMKVVDDQAGCPTFADDLAIGTLQCLDAGASGVVHLTNGGATTWYEFASAAIEHAGLHPAIEACATSEFPTPARRPAYSVLGSERLHQLGLDPLPPWRDGLATIVDSLYTNGIVERP